MALQPDSTHRGDTLLDDVSNVSAPADAPRTIRFSAANTAIILAQRARSYPGGHAQEQGGTIFADEKGRFSIQNIGGLAREAGSFLPNLLAQQPSKFTLVGVLHTHPYDRTEGSFNGVSFSGGDIAYQLINKLKTIVSLSVRTPVERSSNRAGSKRRLQRRRISSPITKAGLAC